MCGAAGADVFSRSESYDTRAALRKRRSGETVPRNLDQDLQLARQALDAGTQQRAGRTVRGGRQDEEETAYLRAMAHALVYLAESMRPGASP